jgi:hypothetical protein
VLDRAEFKLALIKPMLVFLGIAALLAACSVEVVSWRGTHGRPHWSENIVIWNCSANMLLIVGWIAYVWVRRAKASRQR